ncbi:hypothetical protein SAMN03159371_03655 [Variovorax sp. NFACC28]|nr:hypothetical protein SAMN03159371_03655 [Variovorax sp. NFACC28]SEG77784.1 hypothetical protein SAMN03159365_03734 [Variovorax sp. NFACC29]SFC96879.1 hypothetical protein SAMN03159379_03688 [Variovorax sp. NFACC26]SFG09794.1 hypothetical protein SAMN03159447_01797 [Variovorax sp. NFACC27]
MPGTQAQLAQRAQRSIKTVSVELAALVLLGREAHIGDWLRQPRGGKPIAIYVAGPGANAPRPPLTPGALYTKRSRVRSGFESSGGLARA